MTGEVTLNGRVLPIGGVKQKLLAAQRAGLTEVFVPQRNEPDLDDVPAEVLEASPCTWSATSSTSSAVRSTAAERAADGRADRAAAALSATGTHARSDARGPPAQHADSMCTC